jgi:hypothetical protein
MNEYKKATYYDSFLLLSLTGTGKSRVGYNYEMHLMKEFVLSLQVVLKARRNTAKVFREKQRGGGMGEGRRGNKGIANEVKGV